MSNIDISYLRSTKFKADNFDIQHTIGVGTFGRVRLVKLKSHPNYPSMAMKVLKKSAMVKLGQIEHTKNEKQILEKVHHPFIIKL
jgi:serine/threonine protein kinase